MQTSAFALSLPAIFTSHFTSLFLVAQKAGCWPPRPGICIACLCLGLKTERGMLLCAQQEQVQRTYLSLKGANPSICSSILQCNYMPRTFTTYNWSFEVSFACESPLPLCWRNAVDESEITSSSKQNSSADLMWILRLPQHNLEGLSAPTLRLGCFQKNCKIRALS